MIISSYFRALALAIITGHYTITARADELISVEQGRPTVVYSPTAGISSPRSDVPEEVPLFSGKASKKSPSIGSKHVNWRDSNPSSKRPSNPSSNPSSPPSSSCVGDLPKYINGEPQMEDWVQPADPFWENSKFAGMTCRELEQVFKPAGQENFCRFLSQQIYSVARVL